MKKIGKLLLLLLLINSCASYINKMHREFDGASNVRKKYEKDRFDQYRRGKVTARKNNVNSFKNPYIVPSVQRNYRPLAKAKKRYRVNDIADSQGDGSLWSGVEGRGNYLFTNNDDKRNGDIILIQVADKLKKEMSAELKRAFPSPTRKPKKKSSTTDPSKAPASTAPKVAEKKEDEKTTIHDRISSVVIEEINKEHLLIRGKKKCSLP